MSKNVAVFVDVANIFYAAKAAGVDIDYVTLLKASSAGRDLVRAYAYTGLDPDNENQRNFHDFLRRHGYKVVSKDIRKYGDGKVKANLDIELVVDMMKTARNLDIAIVVSGDGDFAPAIRAVQEMGVRVEVLSFRGNTSSDLIEVADIFTDITQVAKVEKGSSRSGRRVADDEEDLSMTEVPDKLTEGTGDGRRRGRGGRSRAGEAPARRSSTRTRPVEAPEPETEVAAAGEAGLVALPGEKLSHARRRAPGRVDPEEAEAIAEAGGEVEELEVDDRAAGEGNGTEDGARRRRRRRGGRGRGRGRRPGDELPVGEDRAPAAAGGEPVEDFEDVPPPAPRRAAFSFGSVWDSQLGVPAAGSAPAGRASTPNLPIDEDDLEEPEIPEYLLAERRQREARARGRGQRGGRGGAYAAAMDRERFGGGRGTPSRYAEPARGRDLGSPRSDRPANRFDRPVRTDRPERFDRPERIDRPERSPSGEPWSEVPPEIEAMLRAQMASGGGRAARPGERASSGASAAPARSEAGAGTSADLEAVKEPAPARRGRRTGVARASTEPVSAEQPVGTVDAAPEMGVAGGTAPKPPTRRRATRGSASSEAAAVPASDAAASESAGGTAAPVKRATSRRRATPTMAATGLAAADVTGSATDDVGGAAETSSSAAPKRRSTRRKADATE